MFQSWRLVFLCLEIKVTNFLENNFLQSQGKEELEFINSSQLLTVCRQICGLADFHSNLHSNEISLFCFIQRGISDCLHALTQFGLRRCLFDDMQVLRVLAFTGYIISRGNINVGKSTLSVDFCMFTTSPRNGSGRK